MFELAVDFRLCRGLAQAVHTPILLAGPTTSGKSALALKLARSHGGVIINADSMQVYRDFDAAENYSVGRWCVDAAAALKEAERDGLRPILVGGTGLYFKALTQGLAVVPPVPGDVRAVVRARLKAEGIAPLYEELRRHDPAGAERLMPGDRSRITRALEVVL